MKFCHFPTVDARKTERLIKRLKLETTSSYHFGLLKVVYLYPAEVDADVIDVVFCNCAERRVRSPRCDLLRMFSCKMQLISYWCSVGGDQTAMTWGASFPTAQIVE